MRVIRAFGFAGSVGTYRAVAQISGCADTFTPTADSAPVHGAADVASALRRYEALRRPRATRLQEMSRANKTRFHLPDGLAQEARDAELATRGDRTIAALGWLYGHDASAIAKQNGSETSHRFRPLAAPEANQKRGPGRSPAPEHKEMLRARQVLESLRDKT